MTRYSAWANQLVFEAVSELPPDEVTRPRAGAFRNIAYTLNHNYVIDQIFQAHLEGRPHGFVARNTPEAPALADLWRAQRVIDDWYISYSDAVGESELGETIPNGWAALGFGYRCTDRFLQSRLGNEPPGVCTSRGCAAAILQHRLFRLHAGRDDRYS